MGSNASRPTMAKTPIPQQYGAQGVQLPQYNMSRPGTPMNTGMGRMSPPPNQMMQMPQQSSGMGMSPFSYGNTPSAGQYGGYPPPSPLLQQLAGQSPHPYQQQLPMSPGGYRDVDYAAVANIAGLNPADVALLHREYVTLTRGGINKIDRVCFRQLLREAMVEANNENIDRTIENIFISIDRNRDGFIDFPEFVGAFRDVLRGGSYDAHNYIGQNPYHDDHFRSNPNIYSQSQLPGQVIQLPSSGNQQTPMIYNGPSPLYISVDSNQSPYILQS